MATNHGPPHPPGPPLPQRGEGGEEGLLPSPLCGRGAGGEGEERNTDMLELTINGQPHTLPQTLSLAELLQQLGYTSPRVAVEVNREVVPRPRHAEHLLRPGDAVEIVTLVGGGAPEADGVT